MIMLRKGFVILVCFFAFGCKSEKAKNLETLQKFVDSGSYNEAIALSNQLISKYPGEEVAYYERGWSFLMTQKRDEAKSDFETCLKINKDSSDGYKGLASLAMTELKFDLSEIYFQKALEKATDNVKKANILASIALSKRMLGKNAEAINDYDQAIKLNDDGSFYDSKAAVWLAMGEKEKAEKEWETGITKPFKEDKFKSRTYFKLAEVKYGKKDKTKASEFIDKAIEIEPTNESFLSLKKNILAM
jgi:tetratricopeptide (TPR) repeat protein